MYYIGIDPGKKGGISILKNKQAILSIETPIGVDKNIDIVTLSDVLQDCLNHTSFCCIEKSQPMPKQGVVSVFNYGKGYGELLAMLKILKVPFQEIQPQKWKKEFNLIKKDKSQSILVAEQLFPQERFLTKRMRLMDGKAESLLMAEYARRFYK